MFINYATVLLSALFIAPTVLAGPINVRDNSISLSGGSSNNSNNNNNSNNSNNNNGDDSSNDDSSNDDSHDDSNDSSHDDSSDNSSYDLNNSYGSNGSYNSYNNQWSLNNYGGYSNMDSFDNFYGYGNYDGSHNRRVVKQKQVVCHSQKVRIVQQRLAILHEMVKRVVTEHICEVEVQTIVLHQHQSRYDDFYRDLYRQSGNYVGYDDDVSSHYNRIVNDDGSLSTDDLGFDGSSIGGQYVVPSGNNWSDGKSQSSLFATLSAANRDRSAH